MRKYKDFDIGITVNKEKKVYTWTIKKLDGAFVEESAEEFKEHDLAVEDAENYIDELTKEES